MAGRYVCRHTLRRDSIPDTPVRDTGILLNGIDYLEVGTDNRILSVYFINPLPVSPFKTITAGNIRIEGGVRIRDIRVTGDPVTQGTCLMVTVDKPGDFSRYTLRIVDYDPGNPPDPHTGYPQEFDPLLSEIEFSFRIECLSGFDCKKTVVCPPELLPEPAIDYLVKDYEGFRRLMLDRLALLVPDWKEQNPADIWIAMVELLAYTGDYLSYSQDAVATDAYLGTARKRVSVRRHARLLDYPMHEGCNARVWVHVDIKKPADPAKEIQLPGPSVSNRLSGTAFSTSTGNPVCCPESDLASALTSGAVIFETMHDIRLYHAHNRMPFHTWGETECCLPRGSVSAVLADHYPDLKRGAVLIFTEEKSPVTGEEADADPLHRHAVRLTEVSSFTKGTNDTDQTGGIPLTDPLTGKNITRISWDPEDALPFPLCISATTGADHGSRPVSDVSVALGNNVLADHGCTVTRDIPGYGPEPLDVSRQGLPAYAGLSKNPVTWQAYCPSSQSLDANPARFDPAASAGGPFLSDLQHTLPAVSIREKGTVTYWFPCPDLLGSRRFDRHFVVETDENGQASIRFGDGVHGMVPEKDLIAGYRTGNGTAGNIGRDTICQVYLADMGLKDAIAGIHNPLPARGGTDPEPVENVRQSAPQAFRIQERAVTPADYGEIAVRHPAIQKAVATFRWTGSWYTVYITLDRKGGKPVLADTAFREEMYRYFDRYRMAGYDLELEEPVYVPLEITLRCCVEDGHYRSDVKKALLDAFSNRDLRDGRRGFFHPDNFTFGQNLYLSQIYRAAMQVDGVRSVPDVLKFQRKVQDPGTAIQRECLPVFRTEILRLDNDPNYPENGTIDFEMAGGL
jgi:hypothetical protein